MYAWVTAILLAFWVLSRPWQWRDLNRPVATAPPYPTLGAANLLTIGRGLLLPWLAAWVIAPSAAAGQWGGGLYLLFILLDFADGLTARLTKRPSLLGAALDMHYDGWGVFLAAALLVRLGKAPLWYLLVGLARPLSLLAGLMWQRSGRRLHPLAEKPLRRTLAGLQMAYLSLALLPIFLAAATRWLAWLFGAPFLLNFLADFWQQTGNKPLKVAGRIAQTDWATWVRWSAGLASIFLLAQGLDDWAIGGVLLLLGVAPRLSAAALLLHLALTWPVAADAIPRLVSLLLVIVLHFGGGRWCLWAPEEALFTRHLGGK